MEKRGPAWLKPVVDYGPIAAFFGVYLKFGLMTATGALMAATAAALVLSFAMVRRIAWMPLITAIVVGVFGGLTLWLNDETFIKIKPTIVEGLFSVVLLGGLALRRPLLKPLFGSAWAMDDEGWRRLSLRFALFFAAMAGLNEIVWRTQSTDTWVLFKVFGLIGLTLVFVMAQIPLMTRHRLAEDAVDTGSDS